MAMTREEAEIEFVACERELARRKLIAFTRFTNPRYEQNWHHELLAAHLDAVLAGAIKRLMVFMPPQNGKLIAHDTPVLTPLGWTTHGDLRQGDYVFGPNGQATRILAVSDDGLANVEMLFSNGETIRCHSAHEWAVRDRSYGIDRVCEAGWLKAQTKFGQRRAIMSAGRSVYQLPLVNAVEFPASPLPMDAYALGVWLGDGTAAKPCVTMTHDDASHVVGSMQAAGYSVSSTQVHATTGIPSFSFAGPRPNVSGRMSRELKALGLFHNKHIPEQFLRAAIVNRLELLAGLMDTDGHFDKSGRGIFTTVSQRLKDDVIDLCTTLGFRPTVGVVHPKHRATGFVGIRDVFRICFQPTRRIPTRIPRKTQRQRSAPQRRVGIVDVRSTASTPGRCIQVDRNDGLYLVGRSLLATHNSELVSRRLPALALGQHPDWQIIAASYNDDLARDMSQDVQKVIDGDAYRVLFPETRLATARDRGEKRNADAFDVVRSEGRYESTGVGGGITGKSMRLGIIDDPVKSREEAESDAYRRRIWNWYVGDFSTRMIGDQTAIVLCQTRWHTDDLAGRLEKLAKEDPHADQWVILTLPAVCTQETRNDPRQVGDALWPSRFSREWLRAKEVGSGAYDWSALYQQQPVPPGGAMAQRGWFKPSEIPRGGVKRRCRCWDLAGTKPTSGRDPDYTCGALLAQHWDNTLTIEHLIRVRETANTVDSLIVNTAHADGRNVLVREWQDPGAAGKSVIASHLSKLNGFDYAALPSSGEKSLRWRPFLVQAEGGNVHYVNGPWARAMLDELSLVPYGHDDQMDAIAGAYQALCDYKELGPSAAVILPTDAAINRAAPGREWRMR